MDIFIQPTIAGAAFAALAVAGGAPLFSDGLRTFRLRRQFQNLDERPLDEEPVGFVHTSGRVLLDSPLFSPLTGKPCAGFRLDVEGSGAARSTLVEERRAFRLVSGETSARVMAASGRWVVSETGRREVEPDEVLSENLEALIKRSVECTLLRQRHAPIVLVEHALFSGAESHVVGYARHARPYELPPELELMRTGTDDVVQMVAGRTREAADLEPEIEAPPDDVPSAGPSRKGISRGPFGIERRTPGRPFPGDVDLWMDGGGLLDFVLISDAPPATEQLTVSRWRQLGILLGPAISLSGLIYLAHAADQLRSQGRF
jgi:hypothetical protein